MVLQRQIRVLLDEDTAQFLDMVRGSSGSGTASQFINSLLRQERFRQGFPLYFKLAEPLKPCFNPQERGMLLRSGLLPLPSHSEKKKGLLGRLMNPGD